MRRTGASRIGILLGAWIAALALGLSGCGDETQSPAEQEQDDHAVVLLSFDEVTYADASITTHKLMERVRNQTQSISTALRKADVMVTTRALVDVDISRLRKEPITVVDTMTGITRAGLRARYHFVMLALVPRTLASRREIPLAVLHQGDGTRAEAILGQCTANGEKERAAVAELWTVFDGSLESCLVAVEREHQAIVARRAKLQHPAKEIVSLEFERTFQPIVVEVRQRREKDAGPEDLPEPDEHVEARLKTPGGAWGPSDGVPGAVAPITWEDKEREKDYETDEGELRKQLRMLGGGAPLPATGMWYGSSKYLQPNYAVLYFTVAALLVLLVGKQRRRR